MELKLTHQRKLPEDRADKIFNFPEQATKGEKKASQNCDFFFFILIQRLLSPHSG